MKRCRTRSCTSSERARSSKHHRRRGTATNDLSRAIGTILITAILLAGCISDASERGPLLIKVASLTQIDGPNATATFRITNTGEEDVWRIEATITPEYRTNQGLKTGGILHPRGWEHYSSHGLLGPNDLLPGRHMVDVTVGLAMDDGFHDIVTEGPLPRYTFHYFLDYETQDKAWGFTLESCDILPNGTVYFDESCTDSMYFPRDNLLGRPSEATRVGTPMP